MIRFRFLSSAIVAVLALSGCSTNEPRTAVRKVQMFHLKTEKLPDTRDPMIRAETQQRMWGAISRAERVERLGNYYRVLWETDDRATPAVVRFEFRQANKGGVVQKMEAKVEAPRKSNATEFEVTGPAYAVGGRVVAWRVQVEQGGQVIGEETSFLWD